MKDYRKLVVWQKAHQLTLDVYQVVADFPKDELYGLVSQMKRSAASIPTNIAEGCGRDSEPDFRRFLIMAFGSANELEYQIILSKDLQFLDTDKSLLILDRIEEIKKMLNSLIGKLQT